MPRFASNEKQKAKAPVPAHTQPTGGVSGVERMGGKNVQEPSASQVPRVRPVGAVGAEKRACTTQGCRRTTSNGYRHCCNTCKVTNGKFHHTACDKYNRPSAPVDTRLNPGELQQALAILSNVIQYLDKAGAQRNATDFPVRPNSQKFAYEQMAKYRQFRDSYWMTKPMYNWLIAIQEVIKP